MITLKSILEDAKINTKIDEAKPIGSDYFKSFTQAVEYARKVTEKRGFTITRYHLEDVVDRIDLILDPK